MLQCNQCNWLTAANTLSRMLNNNHPIPHRYTYMHIMHRHIYNINCWPNFLKNNYTKGWGYGSVRRLLVYHAESWIHAGQSPAPYKIRYGGNAYNFSRSAVDTEEGVFRLQATLRYTKPKDKLQCTWDPVSKKKLYGNTQNFGPWLSISLRQFLCFIFVVVLLLLLLFETRSMYPWLAWHSQRSSHFCLKSPGIKGKHHHT